MAGRHLTWNDGDYPIELVKDSLDNSFQSEKQLCDYIELNIELFTKECLGFEYLSHKREYPLFNVNRRSLRGNRRIDFLIKTKCGKNIAVECKKPKYDSELSAAIGQCLSYIALFECSGMIIEKIVLLSTKVDYVIPLVINKFNLPVQYICFDKSKHLTLIRHDK